MAGDTHKQRASDDPFKVIQRVSGDAIDIVHRDQAGQPERPDSLRRRFIRANGPLAIRALVASQEVEDQGLTPAEAYLAGMRDLLAILDRQYLIETVEEQLGEADSQLAEAEIGASGILAS